MQGPWGRKPEPEASGGRGSGQGALAPADVHPGHGAATSAGAQHAFPGEWGVAQLSSISGDCHSSTQQAADENTRCSSGC